MNATPFTKHAACLMDAVGDPKTDVLNLQLGGVPVGDECGIMGAANLGDEGEDDGGDTGGTDGGDGDDEGGGFFQWLADVVTTVVTHLANSAADPVTGTLGQGLSEQGADAEKGALHVMTQGQLRKMWFRGDITDEEFYDNYDKNTTEITDFIQGKKGAQSCIEGSDCDSDCTAVGAQVAAVRACDEAFVEDLGGFMHAPSSPTPGDLGPLIQYAPGSEPVTTTIGACLTAMSGGFEPEVHDECGLVVCADGVALASNVGKCCGVAGNLTSLPVHSSCLEMQCADGAPAVDANGFCSCNVQDSAGGEQPPVPTNGPGLPEPGFDVPGLDGFGPGKPGFGF